MSQNSHCRKNEVDRGEFGGIWSREIHWGGGGGTDQGRIFLVPLKGSNCKILYIHSTKIIYPVRKQRLIDNLNNYLNTRN